MVGGGGPLVDVNCHTNLFTIIVMAATPLATPKPKPIAVANAFGLRQDMQRCGAVNVAMLIVLPQLQCGWVMSCV
jgi:hypothetical protein